MKDFFFFSMETYWSAQLTLTHLSLQHYLNTRATQSGRRVHVPSTETNTTSKHRQRKKRLLRSKVPPPSVAHRPGSLSLPGGLAASGAPVLPLPETLSELPDSFFYFLILGPSAVRSNLRPLDVKQTVSQITSPVAFWFCSSASGEGSKE